MLFFKSSDWLCINFKKLNSELSLCVGYKMDISLSLSLTPPPLLSPLLCISVRKQSWLYCFEIRCIRIRYSTHSDVYVVYPTANPTAYIQIYKRY